MAGFYGKMPLKGDFVSRGLPGEFIAVIDPWLQQGMTESRSVLADGWLSCYQIAPIWHYCLASGVIDQQTWCGVLIPSEDRVHRSFPLTVVAPGTKSVECLRDLRAYKDWFRICEDLLLAALSSEIDFEVFCDTVVNQQPPALISADESPRNSEEDDASISIPGHPEIDPAIQEWIRQSHHQLRKRVNSLEIVVDQLVRKMDSLLPNEESLLENKSESEGLVSVDQLDEQSDHLVIAKNMRHFQENILNIPLRDVHPQPCVWLSSGSERINHQIVITAGLPDRDQFVKLLTGF